MIPSPRKIQAAQKTQEVIGTAVTAEEDNPKQKLALKTDIVVKMAPSGMGAFRLTLSQLRIAAKVSVNPKEDVLATPDIGSHYAFLAELISFQCETNKTRLFNGV